MLYIPQNASPFWYPHFVALTHLRQAAHPEGPTPTQTQDAASDSETHAPAPTQSELPGSDPGRGTAGGDTPKQSNSKLKWNLFDAIECNMKVRVQQYYSQMTKQFSFR